MSRAHTKCSDCGDIMWFQDIDPIPQKVICPCGSTTLTEDGAEGNFEDLTQEEIDNITT